VFEQILYCSYRNSLVFYAYRRKLQYNICSNTNIEKLVSQNVQIFDIAQLEKNQ
jgi:hypothetical protein